MTIVDELVAAARAVPGRPFVLGIAGAPGSGKSTLAERLVGLVHSAAPDLMVSLTPMDGFHLSNRQLELQGLLERKGIAETFDAAGYAALLTRVRLPDRGVVYAPAFDRALEEPVAGSHAIPPGAGLVVTEGNYLGLDTGPWRDVRAAIDELWFLDVPLAECAERCLRRRLAHGFDRATARHRVETVDRPNGLLVRNSRGSADRVLDHDTIHRITGRPDSHRTEGA